MLYSVAYWIFFDIPLNFLGTWTILFLLVVKYLEYPCDPTLHPDFKSVFFSATPESHLYFIYHS